MMDNDTSTFIDATEPIFEQGEAIPVGNDVEIYVVTFFHFLFSHKD